MEAQLGAGNTAPVPPAISNVNFNYSASRSTFTITWNPAQYDVSHSSCSLYFNVEASTSPTTLSANKMGMTVPNSHFVQTWNFGSPNQGSYIRPSVSTNWAGVAGTSMVGYTLAPATNTWLLNATTFYFRVQTIDSGLMRSTWSAEFSCFASTGAADITPPAAITNIAAVTGFTAGTINLAWTAPGDDGITGSIVGGAFKIRYSTFTPASWSDAAANWTDFTNKYQLTIATDAVPSVTQSYTLTGLTGGVTYYIRAWTRDEVGVDSTSWNGNWSALSNGATSWAQINHAPNAPANLAQLDASLANLSSFTWTNSGTIISSFTLTDPDAGTQVRFNLQITSVTTGGAADWSRLFVSTRSALLNQGTTTFIWPTLNPNAFYWWRVWTEDSGGLTSSTSTALMNGGPAVLAYKTPFDPRFVEPTPGWGCGHYGSALAWGDLNGDGNQELAVAGIIGTTPQTHIYMNNGDGTFNPSYNTLPSGVEIGCPDLQFSDFNNDGKMDLLAAGWPSADPGIVRIYLGNGDGTLNPTYVDAMPGYGRYWISARLGDYDNDGNLDIAITGSDDAGPQTSTFRIYHNKGDGTFDANFIEPNPGWGVSNQGPGWDPVGGRLLWGDYDNDGDLDIALCGQDINNNQLMRIYRNSGTGTFFSATPIMQVSDINDIAWIDYDNNGYLDIASFSDASQRTRIYKNNGDGTFNATPVELFPGVSMQHTKIAVGDYDNDGNPDMYLVGWNSVQGDMAGVYRNHGDGTFEQGMIATMPGWGINSSGAVALSDFNNDGGLDMAVQGFGTGGNLNLGVFKNMEGQLANANAPPIPPSASLNFNYGATKSTFTITWLPGQYDVGHSSNSVYFNVEVSTFQTAVSADRTRITSAGHFQEPWNFGSPNLGNFIRPAVSTNWAGVTGTQMVGYTFMPSTSALMLNATYYFRTQTIDSSLARSTWSVEQSYYCNDTMPPSALTNLAAVTGFGPGTINLTWTSPGDDGLNGTITGGVFKIRYSTYTPTSWGDAATNWTDYTNKYQLTIATNTVPGVTQSYTLTGLTSGVTYYIRGWTRDEVGVDSTSWNGNWSALSNAATSWAQTTNINIVMDTATVSFGNLAVGASTITVTSATIYNYGNVTATFKMCVSTNTPGTPWSISQSSGVDKCVVWGVLNSTQAVDSDFGVEDKLSYSFTTFTSTYIASNQNGVSVPPGGTRIFWYKLQMPLASSTTQQQSIIFKVGGQ